MGLSQINENKSLKYTHKFLGLDFFDIYDKYFFSIKDNKINILEIGVLEGDSLRVWKKYFKNANIYGLDVNPECKKHEEEKINIEIGSQNDIGILQKIINKVKNFDIIIDDGSHVNKYTINTFNFLFPFLKSGGLYIIEDLHCCYEKLDDLNVRKIWPGMSYNNSDNLNNNIEDMRRFFNDIFDNLNYQRGEILSIHYWSRICFILKG